MKKFFVSLTVPAIAILMASCSKPQDNFIGKWNPDVSSLEVTLGEGIPEKFKSQAETSLAEMKKDSEEMQKKADEFSIEFKEDGTGSASEDGEAKDFKWALEGDNLLLTTSDEKIHEGEDISFKLAVKENTADKIVVELTAESLWAQLKEQAKEDEFTQLEQMASGFLDGKTIDEVIKGNSFSIALKKSAVETASAE